MKNLITLLTICVSCMVCRPAYSQGPVSAYQFNQLVQNGSQNFWEPGINSAGEVTFQTSTNGINSSILRGLPTDTTFTNLGNSVNAGTTWSRTCFSNSTFCWEQNGIPRYYFQGIMYPTFTIGSAQAIHSFNDSVIVATAYNDTTLGQTFYASYMMLAGPSGAVFMGPSLTGGGIAFGLTQVNHSVYLVKRDNVGGVDATIEKWDKSSGTLTSGITLVGEPIPGGVVGCSDGTIMLYTMTGPNHHLYKLDEDLNVIATTTFTQDFWGKKLKQVGNKIVLIGSQTGFNGIRMKVFNLQGVWLSDFQNVTNHYEQATDINDTCIVVEQVVPDSTAWNCQTLNLLIYEMPSLPTGIEEVAGNTISLYPNPATSNFTIKSEKLHDVQEVTLTNITGQVVLQKNVENYFNDLTFDLTGISSGTYSVAIKGQTNYSVAKLQVIK